MNVKLKKKQLVYALLTAGVMTFAAPSAQAALGSGWVEYSPEKSIHLNDDVDLQIYPWTTYKSVCTPICADYRWDNGLETFRLLDNRTNRAEIRLHNEYSTGSRQFEGEVMIKSPLNDESLMQIFGSTSGASELMIRGYSADNGSLRGGGQTLATNVYGQWVKINVIHLQEDRGNKIMIYINGVKKAEIADNEAVTNYHKYGTYGTLNTGAVTTQWRNVHHYRDGTPPSSNCTATAITPYLRVNDGAWEQTASTTVSAGTKVEFGPQPTTAGSWSWSGCGTSGTSRSQIITPSASCTATAIYVNSCGASSSKAFAVTVSGGTTPAPTPTPTPAPTPTPTPAPTPTPTGSCPQFVNGHTYATGAKVTNVSHYYQCTVGGWCSQGGPYEPGVGWAWTDAWTQLSSCN